MNRVTIEFQSDEHCLRRNRHSFIKLLLDYSFLFCSIFIGGELLSYFFLRLAVLESEWNSFAAPNAGAAHILNSPGKNWEF